MLALFVAAMAEVHVGEPVNGLPSVLSGLPLFVLYLPLKIMGVVSLVLAPWFAEIHGMGGAAAEETAAVWNGVLQTVWMLLV